MIKCLELFSGTRSVGKCCDALGWESISVDMILPADHKVDIMDFDYKQYPKDYFDIVWASPPCTNYSHLKRCWYGRKLKDGTIYTPEQHKLDQKEADILVLKSLEIIKYFNPPLWFLENPQTATLKSRDIMIDIPFYDVDYCMYSDWGYKKRTRIWTNKKEFNNLLCDGSGSCGNMIVNTKQHNIRIDGCSKIVMVDGKKIRCSSVALKEKYKDHENINKKTIKQHKKVLANGYEMIDGKKVLCNTKELREKLRKSKKKKTDVGGGTNRLERYRIPEDLIFSLFLD